MRLLMVAQVFSYISRDPQARSITFWNLGTLSGADWNGVMLTGFSTTIGIALCLRYTKDLNALLLGEEDVKPGTLACTQKN